MKHKSVIELPEIIDAAGRKVLLHSCCAPCSSAILEFLLQNDIKPTVFYSNSNIFPLAEYEHRRDEIRNYLIKLGIPFVEDSYDHAQWLDHVKGLENQPERGSRCLECFKFRLHRVACYAQEHDFSIIATTLASSRWKSLDQIIEAGTWAVHAVSANTNLVFWAQNWRKGGLQDRRNALLKENGFYNQQYCGCEFSRGVMEKDKVAEKDKTF